MKQPALILVLFASVLAASCSKDPVSAVVGSSAHRLLFSPETLRGQVYQYYAMKARVDGVANSDVYLNWEFDSMNHRFPYTHLEAAKPVTDISYLKNGTYKIKASAYDLFNDTLVASDSTVAVIDSVVRSVDLLPNSCDTALVMNANGSIAQAMNFSVKTGSLADFFTFDYHVTGPGLDTAFHLFGGDLNFTFAGLGTYLVRVAVFDGAGKLYGTDSSSFHVTMPKVDVNLLKKMSKVTMFIALDTASLAKTKTGFSPVGVGLLFRHTATNDYSWNGNTFSATLVYDSLFSDTLYRASGIQSVSGTLSADAQSIATANALMHDTLFEASQTYYMSWSGSARDLKLIAVTDTSVVYAVTAATFDELTPDFRFDMYNYNDPVSADVDLGIFELIFNLQMLKPPSAYVVFTK